MSIDNFKLWFKLDLIPACEKNLLKIKRILLTLLAGFALQYFWNSGMSFFNLDEFQVNLFEAAILWIICQEA